MMNQNKYNVFNPSAMNLRMQNEESIHSIDFDRPACF